MKPDEKNRHGRPNAYPLPTEGDQQLKNQPEYIDQQPNDYSDKSISDMPVNNNTERVSNDPDQDLKDK